MDNTQNEVIYRIKEGKGLPPIEEDKPKKQTLTIIYRDNDYAIYDNTEYEWSFDFEFRIITLKSKSRKECIYVPFDSTFNFTVSTNEQVY